jgi:HSP20 family protein
MKEGSGQPLPVRVYQTQERVMLTAPMPGLEPEDISVRVDGRHVVIHGEERGPHQRDVPLAIAEWAIGPYHRELDLPEPVDGARSNATYGNGVFVLSMPKVTAGHVGTSAEFRLLTVAGGRGERVGHTGHEALPHTTEQHWEEKHETASSAAAPATPATYRRILVPLDGSSEAEAILPLAESLLTPQEGDLLLLRVMRAHLATALPEVPADVVVEAAHEVQAEINEYLSRLAAAIGAKGIRVQVATASGEPAERIVETARDTDAALIAMTTHGRRGLERLVLGSVAESVVRHAPVPILLMRAATADAVRRAA